MSNGDAQTRSTTKNLYATSNEVFGIRTMKKDIERVRQGLPLDDAVVVGRKTPQEPVRHIAERIKSHAAEELPPKEVARPLPGSAGASPIAPYTQPAQPSYPAPSVSPSLFPKETRPIEAVTRGAGPKIPETPRGGKIEIERSQAPTAPTGSAREEKALSMFSRIFPSRKRLAAFLGTLLLLLAAGGYVLFAYFGKPLPGSTYIFPFASSSPTLSPSAGGSAPSPTATAFPTPIASRIPSKSDYLPISRLALITIGRETSKAELLRKLQNFADIEDQPGDFKQVMVQWKDKGTLVTSREFFTILGITPPASTLENLSDELTLFLYTHRDVVPGEKLRQGGTRFGILIPVTGDTKKLASSLAEWEATLGGDLAIFALDRAWQLGETPVFRSNVYQGVTVRYQNFPDPYLSVDYALYESSRPPLFLMTTSRESMFAVIGTLNYRGE